LQGNSICISAGFVGKTRHSTSQGSMNSLRIKSIPSALREVLKLISKPMSKKYSIWNCGFLFQTRETCHTVFCYTQELTITIMICSKSATTKMRQKSLEDPQLIPIISKKWKCLKRLSESTNFKVWSTRSKIKLTMRLNMIQAAESSLWKMRSSIWWWSKLTSSKLGMLRLSNRLMKHMRLVINCLIILKSRWSSTTI